jgi:uncharacterized 2Fe-2S/4Fe-4S cluster protein (DUF4445 family)
MRAAPGAVSHARTGPDGLALEVIGGGEPSGLCGTGLVDVVACLLRIGLIDETGRLGAHDPRGANSPLRSRLRERPDGPEFVLASGVEREVVLTQRDVRELQLAKGAISAGATVLLEKLGTGGSSIGQVLLAGAFGSTIDPESAVAIGLLPEGVEASSVRAVGNAAAAGARAAALSKAARAEATDIARRLRPVELSADASFRARFAEAMTFPVPETVAGEGGQEG